MKVTTAYYQVYDSVTYVAEYQETRINSEPYAQLQAWDYPLPLP